MSTWLRDNNGNRCLVEHFGSKEKAQKALDSLVGCRDCVNCTNCINCSNCVDCTNCTNCSECDDCGDCGYCTSCSDCGGCRGCRDTENGYFPTPKIEKGGEEIKKLIKGYFEQDNLSTAYPIYFTIRDIDYIPSYHFEEGDRFSMVWDCESVLTGGTLVELFEKIVNEKDDYSYEISKHIDLEHIGQSDCEQFMRDNDNCHGIFSENKVWKEKNMFLFSDEAKQHLKANHYHYSSEAHVYCRHSWRAPKTKALMEGLRKYFM